MNEEINYLKLFIKNLNENLKIKAVESSLNLDSKLEYDKTVFINKLIDMTILFIKECLKDFLMQNFKVTFKNYNSLVDFLKVCNFFYYKGEVIIQDFEYDNLYKKLVFFEKKTNFARIDSPSKNIGSKTKEAKNEHLERMWSLEDVFNEKELFNWLKKLKNAIEKIDEVKISELDFCISPKYDGVSLNLLYENGILKSATTRGDGIKGDLVTGNAFVINGIPKTINIKYKLEIRGEVVIFNSDFHKLNEDRIRENKEIFSNPRNLAAGSLKLLNPKIAKERKLNFLPHGIGFSEVKFNSLYKMLNLLKKEGFNFNYINLIKEEDINREYKNILQKRNEIECGLDGVVFVVDNLNLQELLGFTLKAPKFAFAYKFPANESVIQVDSVDIQVGRSGKITPVANFKSINLDGANISKATLHNFSEIEINDLKIYDYCYLIRSGDVIPKITSVLKDRRNGNEIEIKKPNNCPFCDAILESKNKDLFCVNKNCPERIKNSLIYFASKDALDIEGLGDKIVEICFNNGFIRDFKDIYYLNKEKLGNLEGFKEKKINNILDSIKSTINSRPLWRFINALGIEHIGIRASKELAFYGKRVFEMKKIDQIEGFGEEMSKSFFDYCINNKEKINELLEIIKPIEEKQKNKNNRFLKKTCVITGTFNVSRDEIIHKLESLGAKISNSVSKKTHFLIAGLNSGSKFTKTIEINKHKLKQGETEIEIVDIDQIFKEVDRI